MRKLFNGSFCMCFDILFASSGLVIHVYIKRITSSWRSCFIDLIGLIFLKIVLQIASFWLILACLVLFHDLWLSCDMAALLSSEILCYMGRG